MQAIIETLFDVCYLLSVITIGIRMVKSSKNSRQFKLFGWMAIVLGAGVFLPFDSTYDCIMYNWFRKLYSCSWNRKNGLLP